MYDKHLERIDNRPGEYLQKILHRKLIDKFLSKVEDGDTVKDILEIGPGSGRVAVELVSMGFSYVAIEPTKSMVEATTIRIKNSISKDLQLEIHEDRLPSINQNLLRRFDAVVLIHTLEHASNPYEAHEWLGTIKSMLKPGGYIFMLSPDYLDYGSEFYDVDWSHSFPTTLNNVKEILSDVGLRIIYGEGIRGWKSAKSTKALLFATRKVLPIRFLNSVVEKISGHEKLVSGFASGFLYRNVLVVAKLDKK
jgi:2-polyprenyl-3-methyl-5-hydroxy-6-metoxy-1,4-benzoquinol methylase